MSVEAELSLRLMALVFVVFLATLYLLNIWLFKPMVLYMEKRDKSINDDVQEIRNSADEVELITKEINEILNQARIEAKQMLDKASNDAKVVCEAKIARYRSENQAKLEEFRNKLQAQKQDLKNSLLQDRAIFQDALQTKLQTI
ncbi:MULTISPECIES: F0F1 ATP synthase subunit B family protein [unclassified Helicobacter]|uniref:F0F1 ATP synthase subunit B family protein n=1 Tax=unclassified Helicobacter TaxID=2593540 RepID=UPI000CF046FF|nr:MULTISPECIES: F0F1 ATP synthase subunit B' [unclassified Helicobacter]